MTEILIGALVMALLLALDLAAVAARLAFSLTSHARLLALREQSGRPVHAAIALLPVSLRLRASMNLALVVTRLLLAGVVLWLVVPRATVLPGVLAAGVLLILAVLLFWLEWAIERIVARNPEARAVNLAVFSRLLMGASGPFLAPLALPGDSQSQAEEATSGLEDELKTLMDAGQQDGFIEKDEQRMILSIFDLGDTMAREIMVPRIDMLALDVNTPLPEAVDALLAAGYSRAPVFEESVDHTLGLLYAKDLLRVWREAEAERSLRQLIRPAYFVPEAKKVDELLEEMQSQRIHMAIVVDEYGGVAGLVTLEDIVEEILGEIQDEYDQGEEAPYQELAGGGYLFLGRIGLDDFNEIMGSDLPSEEADTLGGYIYSRLGRVPTVGEKVFKANLALTVEQVSARRIRKVSAHWLPADMTVERNNNGGPHVE